MTPIIKNVLVGAMAILVVSTGAYMVFRHPAGEPAGCPQTPLSCPDGSLARPEGSECAYAPCPYAGPLTGELLRVADGFQLRLAAPAGSTQEVSYALPVQTADTEGLAALVGKNVTVYGSFAQGNTLVVDRYELAHNPDPTVGQVRVGHAVFINGVALTLESVNDSRCPQGEQCARAGSVTARVALKSDTDAATTTLQTGKAPFGFDAFLISILDVKPQRTAGSAPAQSDYVLTFKVADTPVADFDEVGTVVRNNPGLKRNTWYLVYEKPSAPALTAELDLNAVPAADTDLTQGERVHVIGKRQGSVIMVSSISPSL